MIIFTLLSLSYAVNHVSSRQLHTAMVRTLQRMLMNVDAAAFTAVGAAVKETRALAASNCTAAELDFKSSNKHFKYLGWEHDTLGIRDR
jgi:hypothetical protein